MIWNYFVITLLAAIHTMDTMDNTKKKKKANVISEIVIALQNSKYRLILHAREFCGG